MLYSSCYRAVNIRLLYRAIDLRQSRREVGKERGESPIHPLFIFSNLMSTLWTNLYVGECVCVSRVWRKQVSRIFVRADFIITTTANDQQQNNNNSSSDNKIENHETCWLWLVLVLVLLA